MDHALTEEAATMTLRRILARIPVVRHLWQCPGCGAYTSRPLAPGETCGEC